MNVCRFRSGFACIQPQAKAMNPPNFVRSIATAAFALILTGLIAKAQISGAGTTGVTEGSGRGIGSGGVMTGTGPDVRPEKAEQSNRPRAQQIITTATTVHNENASGGKTESQKTRKHPKKTSKHSRSAPTPSASASPR
jgi:hypothetical protein